MASFGFEDSTKDGYIRTNRGSSEETFVPGEIDRYRGVTLVELDPITCTTRNRQTFDTHTSTENRVQLLETLESATTGTIIVGVAADSAESDDDHGFRNSASLFFTRYNINLSGFESREKLAFIMQKGYPKKTVFQRKPRGGESLKMKIAVHGKL